MISANRIAAGSRPVTLAQLGITIFVAVVVAANAAYSIGIISTFRHNETLAAGAAVSDLYPRWRGARDLLHDGTNPYSVSQTAVYEEGFYGRLPNEDEYGPAGHQAFFYPLHTAVVLAPLAVLPFWVVQPVATVALLVLMFWSTRACCQLVGWPSSSLGRWLVTGVVLSSVPVWLLVGWQQPTGFVLALLVFSAVLISRGRYRDAGIALAFATIKPQLVWLPVLGVGVWAMSRWRERQQLVWSMTLTLGLLVAAAFSLQGNWPLQFLEQVWLYNSANDLTGLPNILPAGIPRMAGVAMIVGISIAVSMFGRRHGERLTPVEIMAVMFAAAHAVGSNLLLAYNATILVFPLLVVGRDGFNHARRGVRLSARASMAAVGVMLAAGSLGVLGFAIDRVAVAQAGLAIIYVDLVLLALLLWITLVTGYVPPWRE